MATVTREQLQKALSSLSALEGMASGYCELQDGFDTSKGIAENVRQLLAALASPPAEDEARFTQAQVDEAVKPLFAEIERLKSFIGRAAYGSAQAPPASDHPGPTVINEDDGDVTIDFDYAHDRVVSIRLGEESSGLSAFVDGESHALCPLDRVPPKVLALLRTSAKLVTLRQSDPPGLVALVKEWQQALRDHMEGGGGVERGLLCAARDAALLAYPQPASPQAETMPTIQVGDVDADDMQCCDACGASRSCECGQPPASPQAKED